MALLLFFAVLSYFLFATNAQTTDSSSTDKNSTVVAYVGMSASVVVSSSEFDAELFQRELVKFLRAASDQLVVVTFYPSSNVSLTIVDFVVLSTAQSTAVSLATRLLTIDLSDATSDPVQNIIVDATVLYQPENSTVVVSGTTDSEFSSRDPGIVPELLMWIMTTFWITFSVAFVWWHFRFVVNDRSLYYEPFVSLAGGAHGTLLLPTYIPPSEVQQLAEVDECDLIGPEEAIPLRKEIPYPSMSGPLDGYHFDEPLGCISIGPRHICFTTAKGVFVWGENKWGQLGLGSVSARWVTAVNTDRYDEDASTWNEELFSIREVFEPEHPGDLGAEQGWELTANDGKFVCQAVRHWLMEECCGGIKDVACGTMHTLWLSVEEGVFVCGSNASGQLGLSSQTTHFANSVVPVPQPLDVSAFTEFEIVAIAAGAFHSALLDADGVVLLFGLSHDGQHLTAKLVDQLSPVRKLDLNFMAARAVGLRSAPSASVALASTVLVDGIQCFGAHTILYLADGSIAINGREKDNKGHYIADQVVIIQPSELRYIVQIGESALIGYTSHGVDGTTESYHLRISSGTLALSEVKETSFLSTTIALEFKRASNGSEVDTVLLDEVIRRSHQSGHSATATFLMMPIPATVVSGSWLILDRMSPPPRLQSTQQDFILAGPSHNDLTTAQDASG
jgi:alpha-tubulin suppressor-like RCC1 family protein